MTPLPSPPAEPLHILPTWIGLVVFLFVVALLCAAAAALRWRYLRRRRRVTAGTVPDRAQSTGGAFGDLVDDLRDSYLKRRAYRDGCHALSAAVKTRIERRFGFQAEEMTVAEIGNVLGRQPFKRFLGELRGHQYARRLPKRKDFDQMCRRAKKLLSGPVDGAPADEDG